MRTSSDVNNYDRLGGPKAWLVWILATLFVIAGFAFQTAYGVTSTQIASDLSLTLAQVGILGTTYTWAVAMLQLFSGSVMDRVGIRILAWVSLFSVVGGFAYANAGSFEVLILSNICIAVGHAFAFVGAGMVGGKWFGWRRFGFMFALVQAAGAFGSFFNQNVTRYIVEDYGWSFSLNAIAVIILTISILMLLFMREPRLPDLEKPQWTGTKQLLSEVLKSLRHIVVRPHLWLNSVHAGMTFGVHLSVSLVWGPIFLAETGMTVFEAVAISSFAFLGLLFGAPLWVWTSERIKRNKPLAVIPAIFHAALLAYVILDPSMASKTTFFFIGLFAASTAMNYPIAGSLVPESLVGTSSAFVNTMQFFWTGVLMAIPGLALSGAGIWATLVGTTGIDAAAHTVADFQSAMMLLVYAVAIGVVAALLTKESFPSEKNAKDRAEVTI